MALNRVLLFAIGIVLLGKLATAAAIADIDVAKHGNNRRYASVIHFLLVQP